MNKKEIILRKGQCPLAKMQEIASRTQNGWIFIHKNVFEKMYIQSIFEYKQYAEIVYNKGIKNQLIIDFEKIHSSIWVKLHRISNTGMTFISALEPENLVFLKAEE